jgi:antitoxin ParD1/3/4
MAAKTTSVALGEKLSSYIRRKVDSGEFGSASEVIRDSLRRAEERDLHIEKLRELIREGEESGPAEPFDLNQFLGEMHERHDKDAA